MKNFLTLLKRNTFPFLITLSAISVSLSSAFYSVSGLTKLFAGAPLAVGLMAGSLEVAKLVIASLLYQYWSTLNKWLRTYLIIATTTLVLITSMGIYGFLIASYQQTYAGLSIVENKIQFLEQKKNFYENDVTRFDQELKAISSNINNLSTAKSSQIQVQDASSTSGFRTTISTTELRMAQKRIDVEELNRKNIQSKREITADSLQKYQLQILELSTQSSISGELGPLKYIAELTNTPMGVVINYLVLIIIFVFDPLALSLVIAANFAFQQAKPRKNLYGKEDISKEVKTISPEYLNSLEVIESEILKGDSEFLSQINKIESKLKNKELVEDQQKTVNILKTKLSKANSEINELDQVALKLIDSIKHIDDYLKHHGPYYSPNILNWDEIKLGFAEEDDYIQPHESKVSESKNDDDVIIY